MSYEAAKVSGVECDDAHHCYLQHGKDDEAKELDSRGELVLESCSSRVVAVANRGDHCADPVVGENDELKVAHPSEISICQGPRHIALFVTNEVVTAYEDPGAAQIVQRDADVGECCNAVL